VKVSFRILTLITFISVFFRCAVQEAPSGGPEDTTRPTIVGIEPQPQSTNIPLDTEFHLFFSKSMNKEKTVTAVFLSPVFWDYPKYKWKGKELIITPPENLAENKTYVLTIGADATGDHGNQMGSSISFAFSTGDAIDSAFISGSIYLGQGRPSAYDIWVYPREEIDTALFLTDIPLYATQVDSTYEFDIENIASGNYIVVAVDDKNDDLFWDPTSESIGLPPEIIRLEGGNSHVGIILKPTRRDTVQATISRVRTIDNRKISVEFSQPILEEQKLDTSYYNITASDSSILGIEGSYIGEENRLVLETVQQEAEKSYRLRVKNLNSLWGNSFDSSGAGFTGSTQADTAGPDLLRSDPPEGSRANYENDRIELVFSERVRTMGFSGSVFVIADSLDTLSYVPRWARPNNVELTFGSGIPREKDITVLLTESGIHDVAGNSMGDSTLTVRFRIAPVDTVGTVLVKTDKSGNLVGELSSDRGGTDLYSVKLGDTGAFEFDSVLPGTYYFRYFNDVDSNGVWTPGIIDPFNPAEPFYYRLDSLDVRSRWTTEVESFD
jgi:hypothetical protein